MTFLITAARVSIAIRSVLNSGWRLLPPLLQGHHANQALYESGIISGLPGTPLTTH